MLKTLEIKNFTVFEKLSIDFSSGINIFIGENGTGKTDSLSKYWMNTTTKLL